MNETERKDRIIPLTKWPEFHSWPSIGGLRHLVHFSHVNGFDKVIRRAGRRILISENDFFIWIEQNKGK